MMNEDTETLYLDVGGTAVFSVLHRPTAVPARDTAVLVCPPFGWEEQCSYRTLREWAARLARAGYPTLRLTFPGCGDSAGSPRDPDRVQAWTESVAVAASALRAASNTSSVIALGISLGGLIAYRAAAHGADLDGLVLWATPSRAKSLTRELRAFSRLELSLFYAELPAPPPRHADELEVGGFLLTAQTLAELDALDLAALALPRELPRGALLLERDGMGVDERLAAALRDQGVNTTIAPGAGYGQMTSHPQQARAPEAVIDRVQAWLDGQATEGQRMMQPPWPAQLSAEIETADGTWVRETPVEVVHESVTLAGVLAVPEDDPRELCVVFLNSGAVRRVGPNRMWVEAARRWAQRGVPSLRLDVEGIGDAGGPLSPYRSDTALHDPRLLGQVKAAIDALHVHGVAERFAVIGLCSGAYWSMHAALDHPRVSACVLINPRALIYDPDLSPSRDLRRLLSEPLSWRTLRRNVTPKRVDAVLRWLLSEARHRLRRRNAGQALSYDTRVNQLLRALRGCDKMITLIFAEHEPLEEELVNSGAMAEIEGWRNSVVEHVAVRDHTLRPIWAQQRTLEALDAAVERAIGQPNSLVA